jgi:hypothetical protein
MGFRVDRVALGQVSLRVLRGFPFQYHSIIAPCSFIHQPPKVCNVSSRQRLSIADA